MTTMSDITKKDAHQLSTFIAEKREELRQARFAVAGSKARDVKKMREAKKDIARAFTAANAPK
ncbi:MAG: hypothetical protein QG633_307 [Patescibacteria group bacterium]|nr:hypothetical protein [Patescibacteria group bacterium]